MLTGMTLGLAAGVLGILAVAMAYVLWWASDVFYVEVDPKVEAIMDALPGANCGGCVYVGCSEYAEAVAGGDVDISLCGPGGSGSTAALGRIMGVEVSESFPYRAVVHCGARTNQRLKNAPYQGEQTCEAANLVSGVLGCAYGCLNFGDCVRVCKYDAIHIEDGRSVVDYKKCIGCKACAAACPRNIITMVPFKAETMLVVACSNQDFGKDVKAVCKVGCIGCKACTLKNDLMGMNGNLPGVQYELYDVEGGFEPILSKCKQGGLTFVGKPSAKDLAAVADEELPDRVEADFKTTVDDTEWRG